MFLLKHSAKCKAAECRLHGVAMPPADSCTPHTGGMMDVYPHKPGFCQVSITP